MGTQNGTLCGWLHWCVQALLRWLLRLATAAAPSEKSGQPSPPDPALAVCRTRLRSGWLNSKRRKAQRQQAAAVAAASMHPECMELLHLAVAAVAGSNSAVAAHAAGTMWAQYWVVAGIHWVIAARASLCCCGTRLACRCCFDARMRLHEIAPLSLLRCAQFNDCENRVQQHSRWWQCPRGAAGPGSSRRKWPATPRTFRHRGRWCTLQACPVQTTLSWLFCKGQQPQGSFRLLPRCPPLTAVTCGRRSCGLPQTACRRGGRCPATAQA